MKAAVIQKFGDTPQYQDFTEPEISRGDILINVKAVVLENFDKMVAAGTHYSSQQMFPEFPAIVGHSGVGTLEDGTFVAFGATKPPYGTMAEQTVVPQQSKKYMAEVPEGVDATIAAALPSSALTSLLPLKWGAKLQSGETVLINGATGVSGLLAVQMAKMLDAGRIVGTGRDEEGLQMVEQLGADAVIDLKQSDEQITTSFTKGTEKGYDVVLDFLWGHPTELLLKTFVPQQTGFATRRVRFIQIGQSAGANINLTADTLRTSGLEMMGIGHIPQEALSEATKQVWEWINENKLTIEIEKVSLKNISEAWQRNTKRKRIVVIP
jgi:NADPH2:quinone reductase